MIPLIGKNIRFMSAQELDIYIEARRHLRTLTTSRKPKAQTVRSLSLAWNIDQKVIKKALIEYLKLQEKSE